MRLLVLTQKVDKNDPVLGFFHGWIEEFSKKFEKVTVICLEKGEFTLPGIKVLSLGKEDGKSKVKYILRFYKYIWEERDNYDAVFVHMNQEYVILGWKLWKLLSKKIYLWRNHAKGNFWTRVSVWVSDKVFYTSPQSFTAQFRKSVKMPVGVDTEFFKPDQTVRRIPNSILFMGRIAPVKKVLEFVQWFSKLDDKFTATVAGEALSKDKDYEKLVQSQASDRIKFTGVGYTREEELELCRSHEIYVNKTPAGSMDKTIFEAAACGMNLMVDNPDAKDIEIKNHTLQVLMDKLKVIIMAS